MRTKSESGFSDRVAEMLAGWLGDGIQELPFRAASKGASNLLVCGGRTFAVEFRKSGGAAQVATAAAAAKDAADRARPPAIPLVVVPFMGEVGRQVCAQAGVGWMDLAGNASIMAPGLRVLVEGRPNTAKVGRPPNLFAPKSSRLVRWLLANPGSQPNQRELARQTGLDEGFVSRLVVRLLDEGFLARDQDGHLAPKDPALLLQAWRERYDFFKHTIIKGHVAARSGTELAATVARTLGAQGKPYALTGLAAAWAHDRFASFRLATVFLESHPTDDLMAQLEFRPDSSGPNLWLVVPNDQSVFQGASTVDGLVCAHPLQVYLDLKAHHERAPEAAEHLLPMVLERLEAR
jgi:hypothetical protein